MISLNELKSKKIAVQDFIKNLERYSQLDFKNKEELEEIKDMANTTTDYFYLILKNILELKKDKLNQLNEMKLEIKKNIERDLKEALLNLQKFGNMVLELIDLEIESKKTFENIKNLKGSKNQQIILILKELEKKLMRLEQDESLDIESKFDVLLTYLDTIKTIFDSIQKTEILSNKTIDKVQEVIEAIITDFENNNISQMFKKIYRLIDALIVFLDDSKIDDSKIDDSKIDDSKIDFDDLLGKIDELSIEELYNSSLNLINVLELKLKEFQEEVEKTPFGEIILKQFPEARRKLEEMKKYEDINELRNFLRFQIVTIKLVFDLQKNS